MSITNKNNKNNFLHWLTDNVFSLIKCSICKKKDNKDNFEKIVNNNIDSNTSIGSMNNYYLQQRIFELKCVSINHIEKKRVRKKLDEINYLFIKNIYTIFGNDWDFIKLNNDKFSENFLFKIINKIHQLTLNLNNKSILNEDKEVLEKFSMDNFLKENKIEKIFNEKYFKEIYSLSNKNFNDNFINSNINFEEDLNKIFDEKNNHHKKKINIDDLINNSEEIDN